MASKTLLIKGGTIVTMDRERRIIKDGAILIEDGKITSIGKVDELREERADRVIDASELDTPSTSPHPSHAIS